MGSDREELKSLKCASCGGDIVKSYRTDDEDEDIPVAKCLSCGTEYDQHTQEYYEYFSDDFLFDRDSSVFKLGLKGTLNNVEYEIIGRIRYQEEDEYEKSTWDEWLAVSADGVYHYFVEEEGEVRSYEDYVPESIDLESGSVFIEFEGKKIRRSDSYVGRIVYAEGELPWKPEIGEPVTCYDFKKDGIQYSIEQSEDEVTISRGDDISYKEIIEAFSLDEYREGFNRTMEKRSVYRRKRMVYLVGFIVTLCLSMYSCVSETPVKGIMNAGTVLAGNVYDSAERSYFSQVLYGPFRVEKGDSLYEATVYIDEKVQQFNLEWQSFRMMLITEANLKKAAQNNMSPANLKGILGEIDSRKEPLESFMLSGGFWDEQGRDSEGYWHESDTVSSNSFVLDSADRYYAYMELYNSRPRRAESVKITIKQVKSYRYYIIVMIIFLVLMKINSAKARAYNELPFDLA